MKPICVLAYSGGLDTSVIIPWLKKFEYDVVTYCCNLGNLPPERELRERALALGASDFIYEDAQNEFVREYVFPLLRANATYFDDYLLGTAIARPLIAFRLSEIAKKKKASAIAHGATGKGNDHLRFEKAWAYLCPDLKIIAPWKVWNFKGREDLVKFLKEHDYLWPSEKKLYSVDLNSFHRSCEGGELENIANEFFSETVQEWILPQSELKPERLVLDFENGFVKKVNNQEMLPAQVLEKLNHLGSHFSIGVCDIVEERSNGIKSHGVYETPGGTIVHFAMKALKQICWSRELYVEAKKISDIYGTLVYDGMWFHELRPAFDAFFDRASQKLAGRIVLQLTPGQMRILSRTSPYSLYSPDVVSFESDTLNINKASLGYTLIKTISDRQQGKREIAFDRSSD